LTEADFERLSWHDDTLYGLRIEVGDVARGDWRAELVLDLDHIVEWLCEEGGRVSFRVAPATLTFHHVTDLAIAVDWGDSGHRTALHEAVVDGITRARVADQKICLDRPYHRWRIALAWPSGGEIALYQRSWLLTHFMGADRVARVGAVRGAMPSIGQAPQRPRRPDTPHPEGAGRFWPPAALRAACGARTKAQHAPCWRPRSPR
jgi:hypothetical protein